MHSNFANISFLIDNMANPLNLSYEVDFRQENKFRGKTERVFDGDWLSRNAFRERESICGLMMTSCKNDFLKERETFGGKT